MLQSTAIILMSLLTLPSPLTPSPPPPIVQHTSDSRVQVVSYCHRRRVLDNIRCDQKAETTTKTALIPLKKEAKQDCPRIN